MMARWLNGRMALFSLALVSVMWLSDVGQVQAATISDMFELKAAFKEWCKGNPRFADPFTAKVSDGFTITFTRDDSSPSDLRGAINTNGVSQDIDAIPLSGKAFYSNKTQNKLEFVLRGVNPGNDSHFLTLRGQGTVDRFGHLTKVAGTVFWRETATYTTDKKTGAQSAPVECFSSGTFRTGKNLSVLPGGGGGTITVTGAPAIVGGAFVPDHQYTVQTFVSASWAEVSGSYIETVNVGFDVTATQVGWIYFQSVTTNPATSTTWGCNPFLSANCLGATINGATINRTAGTVTLKSVVLQNADSGSSITLNGTLKFTPF